MISVKKNGNGRNTGMHLSRFGRVSNDFNNFLHIDMRVRWNEDSSLLAGLFMPFV